MQKGGQTEQQAKHLLQESPAQQNTSVKEAGNHKGACSLANQTDPLASSGFTQRPCLKNLGIEQ